MSHFYKIKDMCSIAGISKQALWKHEKRQAKIQEVSEQVVDIMNDLRKRHKKMGCRSMYHACQKPLPVGRDNFEMIGFANGFKLHPKRSKKRTTWGQKVIIHPNLIEGKEITGINQVWQSDIFYLTVEGKDYYGFSIEDVYSRRLLALHLGKDLGAVHLERAIKEAINTRKGADLTNCIFHSDRGSQYVSNRVRELLLGHKMKLSMCKIPQENSYVERIQGSLKNQYLVEEDLKEKTIYNQLKKIQGYYNFERPHSSLCMITPFKFEQIVQNVPENERPKEVIFKWSHDLSTKIGDINKKEKRSKKEKSQQIRKLLYS